MEDSRPPRNSAGEEGRPEQPPIYQGGKTIFKLHLSENLNVSRNVEGTDSPPPVYTVSPPSYMEYFNNETQTAGYKVGEMTKDQLPPSYHQLFPSTLASLPPIEIVPTHSTQPSQFQQQHVPYG